jgi:hypothetical protein
MYKAMPEIWESAKELRALMKQARNPQARQRLHALSVVASAQALAVVPLPVCGG